MKYYSAILLSVILASGCTTTEAEKDAQFSTPRIPLSDGTLFTQRATPASTCRQKWKEIERVSKVMEPDGFVKRGKGEKLVLIYQVNLMNDFLDTCKAFIRRGG